jgi:superfamily II DNA or RNA helicase
VIELYENATHLTITGRPEELDRLDEIFRFRPDGYFFAVSYQRFKVSEGEEGWDGFIRPLFRLNSNTGKILRGRKEEVIKHCEMEGFKLDLSHLLEYPFADLEIDDIRPDLIKADYVLDMNQRQCILDWLRAGIGFNKVTVGGGKCLAKGTRVMLVDGTCCSVENLQVGDYLMGPDSKPRKVLSLARGKDELFTVVQRNGDSYACNGDHVLALQRFRMHGNFSYGKRSYGIESVTMTVYDYLKLAKTSRVNFRGYKAGVEFRPRKLPLDPYMLGLWLGDGSLASPAITSGDLEVVNFLRVFSEINGLSVREEKGQGCSTWHLVRRCGTHIDGAKNPLVGRLKRLGLFGLRKRIPRQYKVNGRAARLKLLAGLIDSDGYLKRCGQYEITSIFKELAEDICWLARSLGYASSIRSRKTTCQTGVIGLAYRVMIRGDISEVPVKIPRKRSKPYRYTHLRTPIKIKSIGIGDYYGFELDGDGLFLLGDFTVTHNTAQFSGAAAMIKERYPDNRILYITPSERLVRQTTREMKKFLPHLEIGQCGGGHHDFDARDMVVCTVAMLARHCEDFKQNGWFDSFIAVLFDECQHAGSPTAKKVLLAIPAYFRLGASDTDKEANPAKFNDIRGLLGPMLNDIQSAPLIESGRLAKPHIYVVDVPAWVGRFSTVPYRPALGSPAYALMDGSWTKGTYAGPVFELKGDGTPRMKAVKTSDKDPFSGEWITVLEPIVVQGLHLVNIDGIDHEIESKWCLLDRMTDRAIIQFKPRNQVIVEWVRYFHSQGWPTVVVATRTAYVYILHALISEAIGKSNVEVLFGKHSPGTRDDVFDWFKTTPGAVIVTPLIKEGVSINEIQAMVVADHVSDYEVARQIIGRAMRPKLHGKDNRAHVVWFWDKQHITLRRSSAQVLHRLERTDGFSYFHPCAGPETVFQLDLFGETRAANLRPSSRAARKR